MAVRRARSFARTIAAAGVMTTLAASALFTPTAATAADASDVFTTTYPGSTPGVFLRVEESEGGTPGGDPASFVLWTVVNPTASPVTLTASRAGISGMGAVVEIPPFTEGHSAFDEYALLAGESVSLSIAGLGTITVDRVAAGTDPLGQQTLGDPLADAFDIYVTSFAATVAADGGIDVTLGYRRMAFQPMWLDDLGESRPAAIQLRQYSGTEGTHELHTVVSPPSFVAQTVVLGPTEGASRVGTVTTNIPASPATSGVRTLSLVQDAFLAPATPFDPTLAQGTFAPAAVAPPTTGAGAASAGAGAAGVRAAALAASGAEESVALGGLLFGIAALALGATLVITARRGAKTHA